MFGYFLLQHRHQVLNFFKNMNFPEKKEVRILKLNKKYLIILLQIYFRQEKMTYRKLSNKPPLPNKPSPQNPF